jgi:hypothetical protein
MCARLDQIKALIDFDLQTSRPVHPSSTGRARQRRGTTAAVLLDVRSVELNEPLAVAAIVEVVTGVALIVVPSLVGRLLLDAELSGAAIVTARVAGIGLFSFGLTCWPGSETTAAASRAMLIYNLLVTLYLADLGIRSEWGGVLLWPAVLFHAVMTMGLARGRVVSMRA